MTMTNRSPSVTKQKPQRSRKKAQDFPGGQARERPSPLPGCPQDVQGPWQRWQMSQVRRVLGSCCGGCRGRALRPSGGDRKGCGLPGQPPWPPPHHYPNQFAAPSTLPSKPVRQLCVTSGSTVRWLSEARAVLLDNTGMGRAPPRRQSPSEFRAELS